MSSLLEIRDLKVNYGGIEALKGVSFDVNEGEIVTLIGANGAGKSTTLRAIMSVVNPASGTISYEGKDITHAATHDIVQRGIVLVPEGRRVFPNLTVLENLRIGAYLREDKDAALKIADRGYVLQTGNVTMTGTGMELLNDESIKEAYLGKK